MIKIDRIKLFAILFSITLLSGCQRDEWKNHLDTGTTSFEPFRNSKTFNGNINGIKTIVLTHPDTINDENKPLFYNFIMGVVFYDRDYNQIFDSFCSNWAFFPDVQVKDIDGDGEDEIIVIADRDLSSGTQILNIYRHFPEAESDDPYFMALDSSIYLKRDSYEFKDGKLIVVDKDDGNPNHYHGKRVYKIERYKLALESGDYDLREKKFFLYPLRKESEWLKLKEEYDKDKVNSNDKNK